MLSLDWREVNTHYNLSLLSVKPSVVESEMFLLMRITSSPDGLHRTALLILLITISWV